MNVSPGNGGSVEVNQKAPSSYPAILNFDSGDSVQLEAMTAPGYQFVNWSGDVNGTLNPLSIVIDCNKTVTANFAQIEHTLTIKINGSGSTTPEVGNHNYGTGDTVTITARPEKGWQFDGWTGDVSDVNTKSTTVVVSTDKTVSANFSQVEPNIWWFVGAAIVGSLIIGFIIWLLIGYRRS